MKTILFLTATLFVSNIGFSQQLSLLTLNEDKKHNSKVEKDIASFKENGVIDSDESDVKFPLLSFGSDLTTGSDAVGFRPSIAASTEVTKNNFGMGASIQFTQVDDQKFDTEKTGQTLFINEISNFSFNIGGAIGIPNPKYTKVGNLKSKLNPKKDSLTRMDPRVGLFMDLNFRGNSLFNLDSTTFQSEKNDIFSISGAFGVECILFREYISTYASINYLGITNGRNAYHNYFPKNAIKDFFYIRTGFKVHMLEGTDRFKGLIADFSLITMSNQMRNIAGRQNTVIPVLKIGYQKKIAVGQKKYDKARVLLEQKKKADEIQKGIEKLKVK